MPKVTHLHGSSAAEFHADPEFVPPQVSPVIGDHVLVTAISHHQDLLLDYREIIA